MKKRLLLALTATMLTAATQAQDYGYEEPKRITLTAEQRALVQSNNDFAFRLFSKTRGNTSQVVSPLSITFDLGLLNNGAAGVTQQEICQTLGFGQAGADGINAFCRKMLTEMPALDEQTRVMISDAIFVNNNYVLLPEFVQKAHTYYDATTETRDFNDFATIDVINQWANDHTMGMIPKVLDVDSYNSGAASYLLNAVYFKGIWTLKFNKDETRDESFNGGELVPMMHLRNQLPYAEDELCQMLALPYGSGAYRMTVLLPREGKTMDDVLGTLDGKQWGYYQWLSVEEVDVKLPRMDVTTHVNLVETMKALGMPSAFSDTTADIPYFCNAPVYISNMFQSAKIKMDEEGTEAAAVTVIEATEKSSIGEPMVYEFHANRPFLYIISEQSTGVILFIGQYLGEDAVGTEPSAVQAPVARQEAPQYYDLTGRRLARKPAKGLYIENGRIRF